MNSKKRVSKRPESGKLFYSQVSYTAAVGLDHAVTDSRNSHRRVAAPLAYRPQTVPRVLQTKMPATKPMTNQSIQVPAPPPVYRPQPTPKVLQRKLSSNLLAQAGPPARRPPAPAIYRPQSPPRVLQTKAATSVGLLDQPAPVARAIYRPLAIARTLQQKSASGLPPKPVRGAPAQLIDRLART